MKLLKITFVLVFFIGFFQNVFSQQIKTYQGPYKNGTAVYQYYDGNNYDRIYQGSFKYTSEYVSITGQYKNNEKIGLWTITKVEKGFIDKKILIKEIVTGKYINNKMNGLWTLRTNNLETKKVIINSEVYFKEGYLIDLFKYYNSNFTLDASGNHSELSLVGKFDHDCNFDSTWVAKYTLNGIPFEEIRKFQSGLLYFYLTRNISTGESDKKYDNPLTPMKFYVTKGTSSAVYSTKFIYFLQYHPDNIYSKVFEIWKQIKTPDSYEFEEYFPYIKDTGSDILLNVLAGSDYRDPNDFRDERSITSQLNFNSIILKADSAFNNKKYDDAIILYRNALYLGDSPHADSQLKKLMEISRIESEKKDREDNKKFQEHRDSVNRESAVYKDQLKTQKESEKDSVPKYKRIINVFKKK
jgi:hypothetical protein